MVNLALYRMPLVNSHLGTMRESSSYLSQGSIGPKSLRFALGASSETRTLYESSICTILTPFIMNVEVEPGLKTILELNDDSEDESRPIPKLDLHQVAKGQHASECVVVLTSKDFVPSSSTLFLPTCAMDSVSVVEPLKKLKARKRSKNVLLRMDHNSIEIQKLEFLRPQYNGDIISKLPLEGCHANETIVEQLRGMDKHYDGHAWLRTITSNIMDD